MIATMRPLSSALSTLPPVAGEDLPLDAFLDTQAEPEEVAAAVTRAVVPALADRCVLELLFPPGRVEAGEPLEVVLRPDERRYRTANQLTLALAVGARCVGTLTLQRMPGQPAFDGEVRHKAEQLAHLAARLLDHARLVQAEAQAFASAAASARMALEQAAEGILLVGQDGTYLDANERACALLGLRRHELVGRSAADIIDPADLAAKPLRIQDMRLGQTIRLERLFLRPDGARFPVELTGRMLPDGRFQVIFRDITERRQVEAQLRTSEARYRSLVQATAQVVWTRDPRGHAIEPQPEWCAFTGQAAEEALGTGWLHAVHPDDMTNLRSVWQRAVAGPGPRETEYRLRRHDGEFRHVVERAAPVMDDGHVREWVGTCTDITDRKRAEQALERQGRDLRLIADTVPVGIAQIDRNLRHRFANRAYQEWFGHGDSSVEGLFAQEVFAGAWPQFSRDLARALCGMRVEDERALALPHSKTGLPTAERWVHLQFLPQLGAEGQVDGVVLLVADLSERKRVDEALRRSEEQLRQSQKMEAIGRLAGGIAHDFNNLLTAINGYGELMQMSLRPGDALLPPVEEIRRAGERAAALTRQLLTFSRKQILAPKVVDVNAVVSDMDRMLRRLIAENIELVTNLGDIGAVKADPSQLEQVILNLVINARDAMPDGGQLVIETGMTTWTGSDENTYLPAGPGDYVALTVRDTGRGMPGSVRSHLFEPFFSTKEQGKGTGLGLSTVYGIVKQGRGGIRVRSTPGEGSTFEILLPRVAGLDKARTRRARGPQVIVRGSETVLLVEDEQAVRSLVAHVLRSCGYGVIEASNGSEALELFAQHGEDVDLLLTDMVMPGLGGREVADRILRERPDVRVLFMSGYTDDVNLRTGVLDANAAFLAKPFTPRALAQRVRDLLDAAPTRQVPAVHPPEPPV